MNIIDRQPQSAAKLKQLKQEIKKCIITETFQLPLFTFFKEFSFNALKYENYKKNRMMINLNTICGVTRILEIIQIILNLMEKGQYITKRNLYYKLVHYYKLYSLVDADIELIAFNIEVSREDLHIVSSSRCLLLGNLTLYLDQNQLQCTSQLIANVANYRKLSGVKTNSKYLIIIEKESALHQINQLIKNNSREQQPAWFKQSIIITAKGYPDNTCRGIVEILSKKVQKIYYLGDEDIYGFDILLSYAIGYNSFNTILHKMEWIYLGSMIDPKDLEFQYQMITKQDKKKYLEIFNRNYLKDLEDFLPKNEIQEKFKQTLLVWKQRVKQMKQSNKKIELESFFKYLPENWIDNFIAQK